MNPRANHATTEGRCAGSLRTSWKDSAKMDAIKIQAMNNQIETLIGEILVAHKLQGSK